MDYGKFKYREAKKQHEAKLKQKQIQVKEVKFRPGHRRRRLQDQAAQPDPLPRAKATRRKITLRFRGREMAHQEIGMRLLERIRNDLEPHERGRVMAEARRPADGHGAGAEEEVVAEEHAAIGTITATKRCRPVSTSLSAGEHRRGQQMKKEQSCPR